MTTIHPRRALAEAEAAAWLELHADWCRGLPAEVRDTTVIGTDRPSPDGRTDVWFRFDRGDRSSPQVAVAPSAGPRRDRGTSGPLPTTSGRLPMPVAGEPAPLRGRALRAVAQQDTEQLRDTTVVLGQRVPESLQFRSVPAAGVGGSAEGFAYQRRSGVTQAFADLSGHADTGWMERLAAAELIGWLQAEHGLTDREAEALRRSADEIAQPTRSDRETLQRARRRAMAALSACPEVAERIRFVDARPLPTTGADFGCSPLRALALQEEEGWVRQSRRPLLTPYEPARDWLTAAYR